VFCIKTGKKVVIQWYISCHSVVNNMAEVVNFSGSNQYYKKGIKKLRSRL